MEKRIRLPSLVGIPKDDFLYWAYYMLTVHDIIPYKRSKTVYISHKNELDKRILEPPEGYKGDYISYLVGL